MAYSRREERTGYGVYRAPDKGEVGGSSPPRPTIHSQWLNPDFLFHSQPTTQPTASLHRFGRHSERHQILALRGPCFIGVFLRIEIQRRLNLAVTQDALHGLGLDFRLVHEPVAE